MVRGRWEVLLTLCLVLGLATPAWPAIKVLVKVGEAFFADPKDVNGYPAPNNSGTQVCVELGVRPWGSNHIAAVVECGARTALNGRTWCDAVRTLIIARATLAPFFSTVTDTEILMQNCTP